MDGLSINRSTAAVPRRAVAAPAGGEAPPTDLSYQDALAIIGALPTQAPVPAGGYAPPGASAEQLLAEIDQRLATATGLDATRLATFAAVVASTAGDPTATAQLAQAFRSPTANDGAARLNALFMQGSETTLQQLYYTAAADDPAIGAQLRESFPNMAIDGTRSGATVLASLVREIHDPQAIAQGAKQTCGAASVQILLAREGSAEYVRLVTGLIFDGQCTLQNGGKLTREPGWDADPADTRSITGQLLQAPLMEYANGAEDYDAYGDNTLGADGTTRKGLTSPEMTRLLSAVANRQTENAQVKDWDAGRNLWVPRAGESLAYTMAKVEEMVAKGWSIPVLLSVRPDQAFGHYQLVTRIEGNTVYTLNPWGQEQPLDKQLFEQRLIASFFQ